MVFQKLQELDGIINFIYMSVRELAKCSISYLQTFLLAF
ncbi:hypothetical protein RINTHM_16430 [Richelia intracellularis HM01]|nr:hypothetical protein RINTHM_16430 [Richelia intracellularis HM01]